MGLNLDSKKLVVSEAAKVVAGAQTMVIADYQGTTVKGMTSAYASARKAGVYMHVLKNTLARKAVTGTKFAPLAEKMSGQLVYGISADPIAAAKIINDFAKENEKVKIIAGMYNEQILDVNAIKKLASMPTREELLAMIMGVMQQVPASFVRCVAAVRDQKAAAA